MQSRKVTFLRKRPATAYVNFHQKSFASLLVCAVFYLLLIHRHSSLIWYSDAPSASYLWSTLWRPLSLSNPFESERARKLTLTVTSVEAL